MKKRTLILSIFAAASILACKDKKETETVMATNPFYQTFDTPYELPPFEKISQADLKEAIEKGITVQKDEIDAIAKNPEKATWENTILALENSGRLLKNSSRVFSNLNSANTNAELQAMDLELAPKLSAHQDDIYMNQALFERIAAIYEPDKNPEMPISFSKSYPEKYRLLENLYKDFKRNGAKLSDADKARLKEINSELSLLSVNFGQNVLADTNAFEYYVQNEEELKGLPAAVIETAASKAKEKGKEGQWLFTVHNASVMPVLEYADNRDLREKMFLAYKNRGNNGNKNDNNEIAVKMANLRLQKAQLLGYKTYADYSLEETMAKTPETVNNLLNRLWTPALAVAMEEIADIKKSMLADGINDDVQPWDYKYYSEKVRKEKYAIDNQELAEYFSLDNVRKGIFLVSQKLYGLTFEQLNDVPLYHKEATAWKIMEKDGALVGLLYMDMHPRESKRSGAWMTSYRPQTTENGKRVPPVISVVCNFTPASSSAPVLLTYDEVTTFFHEFGHALHGLLSDVTYESLAGTSVSRDYVELPSQIMENWATDPAVLKMYARHYKTGEPIPDEMIAKLEKSATFGQGFATTEYLASSILDMEYHTQTKPITGKATDFERQAMEKAGLIAAITPRHSSTHFGHIFSGGYSAGYYSYIWSGVLDTDAFDQFKKTDLFDQEKAASFRSNILAKGDTEDPMILYKKFKGSEPSIEPLLRKRGLESQKKKS